MFPLGIIVWNYFIMKFWVLFELLKWLEIAYVAVVNAPLDISGLIHF